MSSMDAGAELSLDVFLHLAADAGLDVSDTARMDDLRRRVNMMRGGFAALHEIDVSKAESPAAFVPDAG